MIDGFTVLGNEELNRYELVFQGLDSRGNRIEGSTLRTTNLNLIPTEPLTIVPFEEASKFEDVSSYHGKLENALYAQAHTYSNATGSWSFYFVHDGKNRSPWDQCSSQGTTAPNGIPEQYGQGIYYQVWPWQALENYGGWYTRPWTFSGEMRKLMSMLQGRRVEVTLPDQKKYKGRCWVSAYDTDDTGRMKVTISYDLAPPANYPNE